MTELIIWAFFSLVQGEGMQIVAYKDAAKCNEQLEEVRQMPDVLVISKECIQVKLEKP